MKLQHLALLLVAFASTSAYASKARLQALGQSENGSYFIKDNRNIFLNPAYLADTADHANFEWGATARPNSNPNAEGGFIQTAGNFKYGIQLGRETAMEDKVGYVNGIAGAGGNLAVAQDTLELLLGSTAGMKWGASFTYQRSKTDDGATPANKTEASGYEIRGGIAQDAFDAHARLSLLDNSKTSNGAVDDKLEGTFGLELGASYRLTDSETLFAEINWDDYTVKNSPETYKFDVAQQNVTVGYAKVIAKDATTSFFHSVGLRWSKDEAKPSAGATIKTDAYSIPVTLGAEAAANDWLTLRGSVTQNVLISQEKAGTVKNENTPNTTVVAAGTGLKFNAFSLDATFAGATNGQINAVNFLSNVGMTYSF